MEFVDYRVENHIAHVVMNRGPVNALSVGLVRDCLLYTSDAADE